MKTNPTCTRPECPREFPEAQNFCNVCGEKLVSVAESSKPFKESFGFNEEAKTFVSRESFADVDDVLQLPQEPFDPMKTVVSPLGTTFPSFAKAEHHEAEESIIDIPESGELAATILAQKPSEAQPSNATEILLEIPPISISEKPSESAKQESFDRIYEPSKTIVEEQKTILEPIVEPYKSPLSSKEEPEAVIPPPKSFSDEATRSYPEASDTILEIEAPQLPKTPYEPPSPFSQPIEPGLNEKRDTPRSHPTFQPPVSSGPSIGMQANIGSSQPQVQPPAFSAPSQPIKPVSADQQDKTLAIISLVLGLLSLFCFPVSIFAMITGFIAKRRADSQPQIYGGSGLALAGMILGGISLIIGIIGLVLFFLGALLTSGR